VSLKTLPVRVRAETGNDATPTGISLGIGAAIVLAAVLVAAVIPPHYPGWRFGVVAVAVGLFAAWSGDQLALLGTAAIAWLLANGFLTDRLGELSWHGSSDFWRMVALIGSGTFGLLLGVAYRQVRELRSRWRLDVAARVLATQVDEEEKRDA